MWYQLNHMVRWIKVFKLSQISLILSCNWNFKTQIHVIKQSCQEAVWFTKISTLSPRDLRCLCLLGKYTDFGDGGSFSKVQPHPQEQRLSSGNCVTESSDSVIPTVQRLVHCLGSVFSASWTVTVFTYRSIHHTKWKQKCQSIHPGRALRLSSSQALLLL